MTDLERTQARITADLLDQGRLVHVLSIVLTAMACALALTGYRHGWTWGVIGFGLVQAYLAVRVGFDARLMRAVATEPAMASAFDPAMRELELLPEAKTGRPWAVRCRGAKRLLMAQGAAVAAQCALAVGGSI